MSKELAIIQALAKNEQVFKALLIGVTPELYLWKPAPNKWCLLEIAAHLYDEEREDFRARTKYVLANEGHLAPPIYPEEWVSERSYITRNYIIQVHKFLAERQQSIEWLQSLKTPNWDRFYEHPELGTLTAGSFLANWLAHDYCHIRQIINTKYQYLETELYKGSLSYAAGV